MLKLPEVGFRRSADVPNVDCNASADWIEANVLFDEPTLSKGDVVDLLLEEQICADDNQDMAHRIAEEAWHELDRRQRWGGLPLSVTVTEQRITSAEDWRQDLVRAFFVLLAIQKIFPDWASARRSYVEQGNLFERVVEQICPALLPGWKTYRAGWSPDNTKNPVQIVEDLCQLINTRGAIDLQDWIAPHELDGGLDLVCYRTFDDEREALPVFFLQCASGKNWREKVHTPDADLWHKWLNAAVRPSTGIVAPFVIDDLELRRAALVGQVIVFDRIRAVSAVHADNIDLGHELVGEVLGWMAPRVEELPKVT